MIRKLLMVAAATAMPVGMVAVGVVGDGTAGAKPPPPPSPPITCAISSTITFAPPGISTNGAVAPAGYKFSFVNTSLVHFTGCTVVNGSTTGAAGPLSIRSKNTKCAKTPPNTPVPGCAKGLTYYDTAGQFAGEGPASIQKALKKLSLVVDGIGFAAKTSSAAIVLPGSSCGTEGGFLLTGSVKAKPYLYHTDSLLACLGSDTGTNTTGNAVADITAAALGNTSIVVATADIDPATSTLHIS